MVLTYESTGEHVGFSWSACDRCGSTLGGDRWEWSAQDETGEDIDGEVCADCLADIEGLDED